MRKKHIVRLTGKERRICDETIDKLTGSSQKARRTGIWCRVDTGGPGWRWTASGASRLRWRSCWTGSRRRS